MPHMHYAVRHKPWPMLCVSPLSPAMSPIVILKWNTAIFQRHFPFIAYQITRILGAELNLEIWCVLSRFIPRTV